MLVVGSQKGGVGKTTIVVHLAILRAHAGKKVVVVDTDVQASAASWLAVRRDQKLTPEIACRQLFGKTISDDLASLSREFDDVFIDAGGDSVELRGAMLEADTMCIPIRASQLDAWTLEHMNKLVAELLKVKPEFKAHVLINAAPKRGNEVAEARAVASGFANLQLLDTVIHERAAYREAAMSGCAITELHGANRAAINEIQQLYGEIYDGFQAQHVSQTA